MQDGCVFVFCFGGARRSMVDAGADVEAGEVGDCGVVGCFF